MTQIPSAGALKRTPLYDVHRKAGAKMVPFGGWEMPVQYTGIIEEHRTVRGAVGLFDISHMGEFEIAGPEALAIVQRLTTNDASALAVGQVQYSLLCYAEGGIVDASTPSAGLIAGASAGGVTGAALSVSGQSRYERAWAACVRARGYAIGTGPTP